MTTPTAPTRAPAGAITLHNGLGPIYLLDPRVRLSAAEGWRELTASERRRIREGSLTVHPSEGRFGSLFGELGEPVARKLGGGVNLIGRLNWSAVVKGEGA